MQKLSWKIKVAQLVIKAKITVEAFFQIHWGMPALLQESETMLKPELLLNKVYEKCDLKQTMFR